MMQNSMQILRLCPLFDHADKDILEAWCREITIQPKQYYPDEIIHMQGDPYDSLIVLLEGRVTAQFQDSSGKVMLVETMQAPEAVATAVIYSQEAFLPVMLLADSRVRLLRIPRDALTKLFQQDTAVMMNYLRDMGDKLIFLAEKVRLMRFSTLRQKLASYILHLQDIYNKQQFSFVYSREKMAEMFGVERPSLSRELSRIAEDGLISLKGRHVSVLQPVQLRDILED